ncbi:RNA polymerase sigma factor [Desulfitobacterium sp. AusDCA]|uniref:RNA polymerase sigma factor n=1 Tax=Desulfitobacterium sp. AusDCA TaxID=3240383 RepID=UPI003DA6F969
MDEKEALKNLAELEKAIYQLRQQQQDLKALKKNDPENYDASEAKFLGEWLKDLYYQRNHNPCFKPISHRPMYSSKQEILFSDPVLQDVTAISEFKDPFENENEAQSELIIELMEELTLMEWEAVTMVWIQRLGPTEASRYMNCSVNNVSTYLLRARSKMLKKLKSPEKQMVMLDIVVPPDNKRKRTVKVRKTVKQIQGQSKSFEQLALF